MTNVDGNDCEYGIDGVKLTKEELQAVFGTINTTGWSILERVFRVQKERIADEALLKNTTETEWQQSIGCIAVLKFLLDIQHIVEVQCEQMKK